MTETKKENEREIVLAILIEVLEKNQFSHIVIARHLINIVICLKRIVLLSRVFHEAV